MNTVKHVAIDGLQYIEIDNALASCRVSLYGGHVVSFTPKHDNRERLWLSPKAVLDGSKPIRGGIPVCWPWFSDAHGQEKGALPSHGFVRTQQWTLNNASEDDNGTIVELVPGFTKDKGFDVACTLVLRLSIGKQLKVELITTNTDSETFRFDCALHTYFAVNDIDKVSLTGLDGQYKDKLSDWQLVDTPVPYVFDGETDRIHLSQPKIINIHIDEQTSTVVESLNHDSVVVWNPGEKATSMADMSDDGNRFMVCVETAITQGKSLAPGESVALTQIIQ